MKRGHKCTEKENYCKNGGVCDPEEGCICPDGFTGKYCEKVSVDCMKDEPEDQCSGNGRCVPFIGCKCLEGFSGDNCEEKADSECSGLAGYCLNDGVCSDDEGCVCAEGFYGKRCEREVASCYFDDDPCSGVGKCDRKLGCLCPKVI